MTIDLTAATMDDSDWNERLRIWINSGDMPDVAHWGFNYGELADYAAQDAVYRFPDDWKERWPNVAKTQSYVPGAACGGGKTGRNLCAVPHHLCQSPAFRAVELPCTFVYAERLDGSLRRGNQRDLQPSELVEIAEKFRDQDPGGLGSQLVPISIRTYDMLKLYPAPTSLLPWTATTRMKRSVPVGTRR